MTVRTIRNLGITAAFLAALSVAHSPASARRGPGGEVGLGLSVGKPTALELVYAPWESHFSLEAQIGTAGFASEGYGSLSFYLHSPELVRRPLYSARLALGAGLFASSEELVAPDAPGEFGGIGTLSLRIDMSAMPMQMVLGASIRRAFVEFNDRDADDYNLGVTGGFRYFF